MRCCCVQPAATCARTSSKGCGAGARISSSRAAKTPPSDSVVICGKSPVGGPIGGSRNGLVAGDAGAALARPVDLPQPHFGFLASSSSVAPAASSSSNPCACVSITRRARSSASVSRSSGSACSNVVSRAASTPFTRNSAGPRSVSIGPTTAPPSASKTGLGRGAEVARPRRPCRCPTTPARVRRPASRKPLAALGDPFGGIPRRRHGVGEDQPFDQPPLGLAELVRARLVRVAQRRFVHLHAVEDHLRREPGIGDGLRLGQGEAVDVLLVPAAQRDSVGSGTPVSSTSGRRAWPR